MASKSTSSDEGGGRREAPQKVFVRAAAAPSACPAGGASGQAGGSCPVAQGSSSLGGGAAGAGGDVVNPLNNMPYSLSAPPEQASAAAAGPAALGTKRQASSIPMVPPESAAGTSSTSTSGGSAGSGCAAPPAAPGHQAGNASGVWMYPSEQMFYNAMKRKGWSPSPEDMSTVVAIHNGVNERAWAEVLVWERLHACDCPGGPRLKKFAGRPSDYSPKARLLNFLGFKLPFDRHDWVVDRCGRDVRYVIDFYGGAGGSEGSQGGGASFYLDVRPALDSLEAAWDRLRMQAKWALSGRWMQDE